MTEMPTVHVVEGRQKKLLAGSPWIYRNEIASIDGEVEAGGLVRAVDFHGRRIGTGILNP
ncbi:MAG: rRNA large subunit methyltransferase I, partial [Clostridia bacterium]|nr:rRNA large subunit methyltransferase I [Clostridia bacterium]